jgi:hypothetical protein
LSFTFTAQNSTAKKRQRDSTEDFFIAIIVSIYLSYPDHKSMTKEFSNRNKRYFQGTQQEKNEQIKNAVRPISKKDISKLFAG